MEAIWKFPLEVADRQTVAMPAGSRIIAVQAQDGQPCIWAAVYVDEKRTEHRVFDIIGTGHQRERIHHRCHVGTFTSRGGCLVFHVFEVTEVAMAASGEVERG